MIPVLILGILAFTTCQLENMASNFGLSPDDFWGRLEGIPGLRGAIGGSNPIVASACCHQEPATSTAGPADWAVNGDNSNWWHSGVNNGHESDEGVPLRGAHWITLDLGELVEIGPQRTGVIGYVRGTVGGGLGVTGHSYEIFVSTRDFGWNTADAGIHLLDTGTVAHIAGMAYIYLTSAQTVSFRYIQIRWRYADTVGAAARNASAANIIFRTIGTELCFAYLTAVVIEGRNLLFNTSITDVRRRRLLDAVEDATPLLEFEFGVGVEVTPEMLFLQQLQINQAADRILAQIYILNPPRRPPEIILS